MTTVAPPFKLSFTARCGRDFVPRMRRLLQLCLLHVRRPPRHLNVALVGDVLMAGLHRRFLGIDGPTDVLTFPLEYDDRGRVLDGEIVICVPFARRAARARGTEPSDELLLYALHGALHLSGYDDTTPRGFRRMHAMEDAILDRVGVGPVFRDQPPVASRRRQRP